MGSAVSMFLAGLAVGCSDETTTTTTTATSSSVAASSGAGGAGGEATGGTGGSGQGGAGQGGDATGGGGGAGGAAPALFNGCDEAKAVDETGKAAVTIMKDAAAFKYNPPCVKIKKGTDVTFMMNFTMHPLVGGTIVGGVPTPDAASPIPATNSGMSVTAKLADEGTFGFYCSVHAPGMAGALFVVP